ncbi:hypothetical protein E9536_40915 [Burkholderia sp. LS-044]|uniref:hypothetical protein n=1 Tax=Burkholderia sp. LS-044 TaxID=1459967 RepID=UPI0010A5FFF4|nr:hypothetical protein [Burkholderia sp. LS-044]THJ45642.1 hypothetical protein E9536_40915 [Burkholderia sp. LS-044]
MQSQQNHIDMAKIWFSTDSGVSVGNAHGSPDPTPISFLGGKAPIVRAITATGSGEIWLIGDENASSAPHSNNCSLWRIVPGALEAHQVLTMQKHRGLKLVIDTFGYLWAGLCGPQDDKGKVIQLTPTGEVAAEFGDLPFVPEHLAYTSDDTVWAASSKVAPQVLTPSDGKLEEISLSVKHVSEGAGDKPYVLHVTDAHGKGIGGRRVTLSIASDHRSRASFVGYAYDQPYTKTLTTDGTGAASFALRGGVDTLLEGQTVSILAISRGMPKPITVYSGPMIDVLENNLAITDLTGHFSTTGIGLTGRISGAGLSAAHPAENFVTLSMRPSHGAQLQTVPATQIKWAKAWEPSGWFFQIPSAAPLPTAVVPELSVQAHLGSSNQSLPTVAQFPFGAFMELRFKNEAKELIPPYEEQSVNDKFSYSVHIICRHPIDKWRLSLKLDNGITVEKPSSSLNTNPDWNGLDAGHLVLIDHSDVLKIPQGSSTAVVEVFLTGKVSAGFSSGNITATLHGESDILPSKRERPDGPPTPVDREISGVLQLIKATT